MISVNNNSNTYLLVQQTRQGRQCLLCDEEPNKAGGELLRDLAANKYKTQNCSLLFLKETIKLKHKHLLLLSFFAHIFKYLNIFKSQTPSLEREREYLFKGPK